MEKKAARKGYEEEKRASVPYTRPSYAHYYPASDQSLTNIPAFSQRNWLVRHSCNKSVYFRRFHEELLKMNTRHGTNVKTLRRPPPRSEEKPVTSVRPVQTTPVPMVPRQASAGSAPRDDASESSIGGFPVNCLQKAGVFVQRIVTTSGKPAVQVLDFFFVCFSSFISS